MRRNTARERAKRRQNRRRAEIEENTRVLGQMPYAESDEEEDTPSTDPGPVVQPRPEGQERGEDTTDPIAREGAESDPSSEETILYTYPGSGNQEEPDTLDQDTRTETVRMACWSIGGRRGAMRFSEKLHSEYAREVLEKNDIIAFVETHTDEDEVFDLMASNYSTSQERSTGTPSTHREE